MTKSIKTNWWLLLLAGIIFLILSVKVMIHPARSIIELAFFIGWASLIAGIFQVGFALSAKNVVMKILDIPVFYFPVYIQPLKDRVFRNSLRNAKTASEAFRIIKEDEERLNKLT